MNIEQIIKDLTTEEKVRLLAGATMWTTEAVDRLGVPSIVMTDGPHGVRLTDSGTGETKPATSFPAESAMAATWNTELIGRAGSTMAEECQHYGVSILLGPGVNGKRSPLCGRNFEYYSEDPYLTGRMGAAFVHGVQSRGIGTSVKHFVANEQEKNRMVVSSEVDERTLREMYLLPFEMVVKEANPWTVMCSYNKVNAVQMSSNDDLLNGVLKDQWGFEGVVVSDWGAVVNKAASVENGLDLEMPGPGRRSEEVLKAYKDGAITDTHLDDHVRRLLTLVDRAEKQRLEVPSIDWPAHHSVAREVAEESIVLLKNQDQLLPLSSSIEVAVIGSFAVNPRFQGGGSSHMNPAKLDIPLDGISENAQVLYSQGYEEGETSDSLIQEAVDAARGKDAAVVFVGTTDSIETEGYDRADLRLPESHYRLVKEVSSVNQNVVVVNYSGAAVDLYPIDSSAKAILHAWLPGQAGGSALANILFGKRNPSGRLSETFPVTLEHTPAFLSFPGDVHQVAYSEGIFTGYRHYSTRKLPVQYAFGYGLSYTTFGYSNLAMSTTELSNGDTLEVGIDVTNTGRRAGKEVVQVYVHDVISSVPKAAWELKGFGKVFLEPGETKTVTIELEERAFSHYSTYLSRFAVESGEFVIGVGRNVNTIDFKASVVFDSNDETREPLTLQNDITDWLDDARYSHRTKPLFEKMRSESTSQFFPLSVGMPLWAAFRFLPHFGVSSTLMKEFRALVEEFTGK